MIFCQLFLGVLLILTANEASAQDECAKGFPFACFVHLWENENNAGKEFVHAFNTAAFFDAHCNDIEKCNADCPSALTKVDKSDLKNKGLVFKCNPKNLFCSKKKKVECIPIRNVYRLSEKKPFSQPVLQKASERTNMDLDQTKATAQESSPESDDYSFVPDLVEIQTIVLPICRREDTEQNCMALTSGRFCTTQANTQYFADEYLPWTDIKTICTIVESPLGGVSPKWLAKYAENKKKNLQAMKIVWEYTGFPFDIVTSAPFLTQRHDYGAESCEKYADHMEHCLPLPICDDGEHFITYSTRMINVFDPNDYFVEEGKSECERACETWEVPTLVNKCRILDIEHLPLDRQNSPPYAKFATVAENLQRRKSAVSVEMRNLSTINTEKPSAGKRAATSSILTPYYGRPIDLKTASEQDYPAIESNYWLSMNRNPFYKKYGDKIKPIDASACAYDPKETFCRSPPTNPNIDVYNTSQTLAFYNTSTTLVVYNTSTMAAKKRSLPWWAILTSGTFALLIALFLVVAFCFAILLSIGAGIWIWAKKRTEESTSNSLKTTQSSTETIPPMKSTIIDVTQEATTK